MPRSRLWILFAEEKFGDVSPSFGELKKGLETVRHSVHLLLQKKRETEPDAVEVQAEGAGAEGAGPRRGDGWARLRQGRQEL